MELPLDRWNRFPGLSSSMLAYRLWHPSHACGHDCGLNADAHARARENDFLPYGRGRVSGPQHLSSLRHDEILPCDHDRANDCVLLFGQCAGDRVSVPFRD